MITWKTFLINVFLFFSILFLSSCEINNDYTKYHQDKNIFLQEEKKYKEEIKDFSFEKIKELNEIDIIKTPDTNFLDELVEKINKADSKIYVEIYIFTEKRLKKAILDAKKRWLEVKVLLEKNVYKAPYLNNDIFKEFEKWWIEVKYSKFDNYSLNHTKLMIIDDEAILSTWNYSYSTFKYNREFFLIIKNKDIYNILSYIFNQDFNWIKSSIYDDNLVLSPFYSRDKIEYIIKNAKKSIKIYSHNFNDEKIKNLLIEKSKEVKVEIIFPDLKKVDSNKEVIDFFKKNKINIYLVDKPEIHAKSIMIDDEFLYIWSINFSKSSIDDNREIWLLLKDKKIISYFSKSFDIDRNNFIK